jgi:hypothetical protein
LRRIVEVVDDLVATREHRRHVKPPTREPRDTSFLAQQLARAQQRLRGHARPIRAVPGDQRALDERHVELLAGPQAGRRLSGRAGADDNDVMFVH